MDTDKFYYAAIIESSYSVEGDERSKTNPGHGYPAHTVNYKEFKEFGSEDEMKEWVARQKSLIYGAKPFKIIKCITCKITHSISVNVEVSE